MHFALSNPVSFITIFEMRLCEFFRIYPILPAALGPGVHSDSNRNEYQKRKDNVSGGKARPVKEEIRRYSSQYIARPKRPSSQPHGATRQQAIAKTPAK
jgi:hypothetical protein